MNDQLVLILFYFDSHRSDPLPEPFIGTLKEKSTQTPVLLDYS